ncbi:MAG TPA: hypothetical protein VE090_03045 [Methylomirabilota bacterium]|nr:hypothetical protein [Methylomirabilota bacterium]
MNIGFDFDKIFIDYPPFFPSKLIDKMYKQKDNGILLYRIPTYPEQLFRKATHLPFLRPPIKENLAFLKSISKKENKLYLISSRYKFLEKETNRLIQKYQLDTIFDHMYFNFGNKQPHLFKDEVLKQLRLDFYIDDDLSLLRHVAKGNPKTKFFWLNQVHTKQPLAKNIFPISKLSEIFV